MRGSVLAHGPSFDEGRAKVPQPRSDGHLADEPEGDATHLIPETETRRRGTIPVSLKNLTDESLVERHVRQRMEDIKAFAEASAPRLRSRSPDLEAARRADRGVSCTPGPYPQERSTG
jgi:hypothetical protein